MIAITYDKVEVALASIKDSIDVYAQKKQTELESLLSELTSFIENPEENTLPEGCCTEPEQLERQKKFLEFIVEKKVARLIRAKHHEIIDWSKNTELNSSTLCKSFREKIKGIFGYNGQRQESYFINYFEKLGIKACVYCNAQSTIVAEKDGEAKSQARFECDHFLGQSEYPAFSMSFYNLYPVCGPCNKKKSDDPVDLNLYVEKEEDIKKHRFLFRFEDTDRAYYLLEKKLEKLVVKFMDFHDEEGKFGDKFNISGIYGKYRDIAEELIRKKVVYTPKYMDILNEEFFKRMGDKKDLRDRLIIGNYSRPEEIHKRPLSKFSQDIARQLGLLQPPEKKK